MKCLKCRHEHHISIGSSDTNNEVKSVHTLAVEGSTSLPLSQTSCSPPKESNGRPIVLYVNASTPILLQTAKTAIYRPGEPMMKFLASPILDSGSQRSYVTTRVKEKLRLPSEMNQTLSLKRSHPTEENTKSMDVVCLCVSTEHEDDMKLSAFVVPLICDSLQSQSIVHGSVTHVNLSFQITGNLLLMLFYGAILGVAAKCISDGAELLLDLGCSPSLIGGIVLPLLGAVPDSAIIIVSGLGPDAQTKLSVGMGTLAGSTIMLLTAAWAGSLAIGKCDLNAYGEAIEGSGYGKISCNRQGVTILPTVKTAVGIMLLTSLSYFIVQGADWHFGPHNFGEQPPHVRQAALVTMIICFIGFVAYLIFLFVDSKSAQMRAEKHRQEMMQRKVLHQFVMMAKRQMPSRIGGHTDAEDKAAQEVHIQKKYFKAWRLGAGMDKKEPTETDPIVSKEGKGDKEELVQRDSFEMHEEEEEGEESFTHLALKCVGLLVLGVGLVTIFADPMCDVLDSLTNPKNKSHIPISAFYVSFVVTPLCSNASELVSSLIFAAKKKKENISMTFAQLYGAGTMNNTLCLGIFAALVYLRDLKWYYSAEVTVIIFVQWVVGIVGFRLTYKLWTGALVGSLYIVSIGLVALLESNAIGWK